METDHNYHPSIQSSSIHSFIRLVVVINKASLQLRDIFGRSYLKQVVSSLRDNDGCVVCRQVSWTTTFLSHRNASCRLLKFLLRKDPCRIAAYRTWLQSDGVVQAFQNLVREHRQRMLMLDLDMKHMLLACHGCHFVLGDRDESTARMSVC